MPAAGIRSTFGRTRRPGAARDRRIDGGLNLLCAIQQPGQTFTMYEIAEAAGVSHGQVYWWEVNALKKLRRALARELEEMNL